MTVRPFHASAFALCLGLTALAGCGGHSARKPNSGTSAPVTSGGTSSTNSGTSSTNSGTSSTNSGSNTTPASQLDVSVAATDTETLAVADVMALAVHLQVTGKDPVQLSSVAVTASGTTDESQTLGELKLVGDDNGNGLYDTGEPVLATLAAPAFPTDDARVDLALSNPVQIAGGAGLDLLVLVDATPAAQNAVTHVGETIVLRVDAAADVVASVNSQAITAQANFPLSGGATTLYLHDHLLISEVVRMGTAGEYIELFNPTAKPIDLSDVYVTDATDATAPYTFHYQNLPSGQDFAPQTQSDFLARFPAGAMIDPGQAITVAMDGTGFDTTYAQSADYCLRNPSGTAVSMLGADSSNPPTWSVPASGISGGLTNNGEPIIVFRWDGQSDLVQDVDYLYYGTESQNNTRVEKNPNLSVDGPDSDTTPSTYLADTPTFNQPDFQVGAFPSNAIARIDFTEGSETRTGGNGEMGHDETSENVDVTFVNAAPTPGTP